MLNNIEILKSAIQTDDSTVSASMYHDNLVWRIIALGANERCLPVLFVTSDRLVLFFSCLFGVYKCKLLLFDCLVLYASLIQFVVCHLVMDTLNIHFPF